MRDIHTLTTYPGKRKDLGPFGPFPQGQRQNPLVSVSMLTRLKYDRDPNWNIPVSLPPTSPRACYVISVIVRIRIPFW